jgi:anti-sigma factor RsiW
MNATNNQAPDEIEELLPWHAAGTLSRREAERVEEALKRDPELARRYALVREELSETIHLNETLGAPSTRALDALMRKIDAEPKRAVSSFNLGARVAEFFASLSPRTLAWSAAAAAVAIVLQAGLIAGVVLNQPTAGGYQTASAPATTQAPAPGAHALIRFAPTASADAITKFLESHKLSIIGGPSAGGLYRVRIADASLPQAERDKLIKTLQADKVVGFIAATQ